MTLREKLAAHGIVLDEPISNKAIEALIGLDELLDHAEQTIKALEAENAFLKCALFNALGGKAVVMRHNASNLRVVEERNISDELIVRVVHD